MRVQIDYYLIDIFHSPMVKKRQWFDRFMFFRAPDFFCCSSWWWCYATLGHKEWTNWGQLGSNKKVKRKMSSMKRWKIQHSWMGYNAHIIGANVQNWRQESAYTKFCLPKKSYKMPKKPSVDLMECLTYRNMSNESRQCAVHSKKSH